MTRGIGLLVIAGLVGGSLGAEPVLARWGGGGETVVVEVRGFDAEGRLRLAPTDGGEGEALIPAGEVGGLKFIFPETYREAQFRVSVGRPAEALFLLQREISRYLPYAGLAESNVATAVRLYLRLLQQHEEWPEAVAVAAELTREEEAHPLTPDVLNLVQALINADRIEDAAWLLGRIPLVAGTDHAAEVERVAAQMRRAGHFREARTVYQRLVSALGEGSPKRWSALAAYCAWHLGEEEPARELLAETTGLSAEQWDGLGGLLRGRVALAAGDSQAALDSLGEALITAPAASEWRVEITALLAAGYAARDETALAERLRADLLRLYPDSLWTSSNSET